MRESFFHKEGLEQKGRPRARGLVRAGLAAMIATGVASETNARSPEMIDAIPGVKAFKNDPEVHETLKQKVKELDKLLDSIEKLAGKDNPLKNIYPEEMYLGLLELKREIDNLHGQNDKGSLTEEINNKKMEYQALIDGFIELATQRLKSMQQEEEARRRGREGTPEPLGESLQPPVSDVDPFRV